MACDILFVLTSILLYQHFYIIYYAKFIKAQATITYTYVYCGLHVF